MDGHNDEYKTEMYGCSYRTKNGGVVFVDGPNPLTNEDKAIIEKAFEDYEKMRKERYEKRQSGELTLDEDRKRNLKNLRAILGIEGKGEQVENDT
jgi:hypothetical protein